MLLVETGLESRCCRCEGAVKRMEAPDTTVGSQHIEASAAAAVGKPTSNGTGVTLKFDGPLKRKRAVDLVSARYKQLHSSMYTHIMRI